jgi:uncharacterized membrane protein
VIEQVNWETVGKTWGPLGVVFVLAVLGIVFGAKAIKGIVLGTIEDARKDRDYMRQQREREATAFIESLRQQGEMMKEGFDEVLREIRGNSTRRR